MIQPDAIKIVGDQDYGRRFLGRAHSEMILLTEYMAHQELNGPVSRHAWPEDGVQITCTKVGGQGYITIYTSKGGGPQKKRQLEKELVKVFVHVDMINTETWTVMYERDNEDELTLLWKHFGTELTRSMISSAVACGVINIIDGAIFWSGVASPYDEELEHDLLAQDGGAEGWEGMDNAPTGSTELLQAYLNMFPEAPTVFDTEIPDITESQYVTVQYSTEYFFGDSLGGSTGYSGGIVIENSSVGSGENSSSRYVLAPSPGSIWEQPYFAGGYDITNRAVYGRWTEGDYKENCHGYFIDDLAVGFSAGSEAEVVYSIGRASKWAFQLFRGEGFYYTTMERGEEFDAFFDYKTTGYTIDDPAAGILWDYFISHEGEDDHYQTVNPNDCPFPSGLPEDPIWYVSTPVGEWPSYWIVRNMLRHHDGTRGISYPYTSRGDLPFEEDLNTLGYVTASRDIKRGFLFEHGQYPATNYKTEDGFSWYLATGGGIISRYQREYNYLECNDTGWYGTTGFSKVTEIHQFKTLYNIAAVAGWDINPTTTNSMPNLNGAIRQLAEMAVTFLEGIIYDKQDLSFEKEDVLRSWLASDPLRGPVVDGFKLFPGLLYCSPLFNIRIYCIPVSGKTVEEMPE